MLKVDNLTKSFGGLCAVNNLSFSLNKKELLGLIGPNGAGKTTVFNLLTGVIKATSGSVTLEGKNLTNKAPHVITSHGIVRTFQNLRLMKGLSLLENMKIAFHVSLDYGYKDAFFFSSRYKKEEKEIEESIFQTLAMLHMEDHASISVDDLPYGVQKKAELARALLFKPQVLLLDEPAAGLNPTETDEIIEIIQSIHEHSQMGIIIVEHNMKVVMGMSERILVMNQGALIAEGIPSEIQNNEEVITAYLGQKAWKKQAVQAEKGEEVC
ncbi:ABC transporter ATP-binding protein [Aminobacterium sp. MB27-C1]|jgi:branched-chain amino acid transport system ATP-binding protein|nr:MULTISPECIES: ABC transporter ATP-binding protein [unclassified Aminobacterium]MEA4877873.1 ABC transporter ATP-binding protein [Aminobacterium sp.]WMI71688.1 ABC transporter ATP-binding protein [Aminobacterium sp. MB27-C1]